MSEFDVTKVSELAQLISGIERRRDDALAFLKKHYDDIDRNPVLGITGPPGVGKSTLVDRIIANARDREQRVAVIAVDPSSPFSGGALLGDRVRMQRHSEDPGVYIRSMSSRGHLGGLNSSIYDVVLALSMSDYDFIILETVGVGQGEVEVSRCSDFTGLVMVPAFGDAVQLIKAGIQEITRCFLINKVDRFEPDQLINDLRRIVEDPEAIDVFPLSAETGRGIEQAYEFLVSKTSHKSDDHAHQTAVRENHLRCLLRETVESQVDSVLDDLDQTDVNPYHLCGQSLQSIGENLNKTEI